MPISTATEFEELVGSDSDATVKRVHSQIRSYVGNNQNSQDAEVLDQVKAISPVLAVTQDLKRTSPDDLWREHEET
jgi:hypothetical protein